MANPNPMPGNNCIEIYDCGPNRTCGDGDDTLIGQGSVDAQGKFDVMVQPPLRGGQTIFPRDVCNDADGPPIRVGFGAVASALSPMGMIALVIALAMVGAFGAFGSRRRC
jgi:hypothetical protein